MTDSGKNNAREPFVRIIKRGLPSTKRALAVRALSLAATSSRRRVSGRPPRGLSPTSGAGLRSVRFGM